MSDIPGEIHDYDDNELITLSGTDFTDEEYEKARGALRRLEEMGMIRCDNGVITIINYRKCQESKLTGYERVKKCRLKKRNDNGVITHDNANNNDNKNDNGIDKIRIDKNIYKDITSIAKPEGFADLNSLIGLFKEVNPNFTELYKNKTQRSALNWLVEKHGLEKIKEVILSLPKIIGEKYAPTITTPLQLKNKLPELIVFVKKQKSSVPAVAKIR
jgi:hypothetical protein